MFRCMCTHGCAWTWVWEHMEVDAGNHPWSFLYLIQWGRIFHLNLELTGMAGLMSHLTLWVAAFDLWHWKHRWASLLPSFMCVLGIWTLVLPLYYWANFLGPVHSFLNAHLVTDRVLLEVEAYIGLPKSMVPAWVG